MSTGSSGLSRRRVGGSAVPPSPSPLGADTSALQEGSRYSRAEDGDLSSPDPASIESWAPTLTLMDEVIIIGLKEKEGYLSFWNDCISYVLRGCIIMELALRGRVAVAKESLSFRRTSTSLTDRPLIVISTAPTGEVLLDEALRIIAPASTASVASWVDLLSGETWNLNKVGLQLKQVRERLAKGLVEKGVLRTERRSFLLFDMATHPVQDGRVRAGLIHRVQSEVLGNTAAPRPPPSPALRADTIAPDTRLRQSLMVCAAYAANVLENALTRQDFAEREGAFEKADALLSEYASWPATASSVREAESAGLDKSCLEVVAAVVAIFAKMDSVL